MSEEENKIDTGEGEIGRTITRIVKRFF